MTNSNEKLLFLYENRFFEFKMTIFIIIDNLMKNNYLDEKNFFNKAVDFRVEMTILNLANFEFFY